MPTYEYLCQCGHEFEEFQSIKAEPGAICPVCGQPANRLMSAGAGLIFKGSGFYITDYKNKHSSYETDKASAKTESEKSESSKTDSPKTDSTAPKDSGTKDTAPKEPPKKEAPVKAPPPKESTPKSPAA